MKLRIILIVLASAICLLTGCTKQELSVTTKSTETVAKNTEKTHDAHLLENVELTLPEDIIRKSQSSTSDYFYKDGEVVGGIEMLDIASQMDTMDAQLYADYALNVTKGVYYTEYDYMVESDVSCHVVVSMSSRDGRTFYHYFFRGTQMGYDVWIDSSVLNMRDMRNCLKTLYSEDLYNPQDTTTVNEAVPLLNLRVEMPDGISYQPKRTTRSLFYSGETLAGGIEQIEASTDLDTLGMVAIGLMQEMYDGEFDYSSMGCEPGEKIIAEITTDNGDTHMIHYILSIGTECYDVWVDTAVISEEVALVIAQSCQY